MKKTQIGAAAMALLLAAGLTACASEPTADSQTQQPDSTPGVQDHVTEDPEAPQEEQNVQPEITVMDQPDQVTVAADDKYFYTLAQIGGVTGDGQYLIQVLHDFEAGETIDFRSMDLKQWELTGEEFLFTPGEGVSYFAHDGETWRSGKISSLRADDYVFLTQDAASGEVYAITAATDLSEVQADAPTDDPVDATTGDAAAEDAADAASNANAADEGSDNTTPEEDPSV